MKLGKILGTLGGGLLGNTLMGGGLAKSLLGMGAGGMLGMGLMGGGQEQEMEEGEPMPQPNLPQMPNMTEGVMGFDPMARGQMPQQMPRQFGRVGNDIYMGGRRPFGQNFLGRLFQ